MLVSATHPVMRAPRSVAEAPGEKDVNEGCMRDFGWAGGRACRQSVRRREDLHEALLGNAEAGLDELLFELLSLHWQIIDHGWCFFSLSLVSD